jgi:hypothetical protein
LVASCLDYVEHGDDEHAGVERYGLAGFEVDIHIVAFAEALDHSDEALDVVSGAGDVVPTAEVEPLEPRDEVAEFGFEGVGGVFERVGVLLAERVEVEAIEMVE